jgi:hypothetical protein
MYGPRKLNVVLRQLRCSASLLTNDLHQSNIVFSPNCACGVSREDAFHFLFVSYTMRNRLDFLINLKTSLKIKQLSS